MSKKTIISLAITATLLTGCAGSPLDGIMPNMQNSISGTWEGNYTCHPSSGYLSIPSVARVTFETSGPDLNSYASLVSAAQSVSKGQVPNLKTTKAQDIAGTVNYDVPKDGDPAFGGKTRFSGYTDTNGNFFFTQERFIEFHGGANARNLHAPLMSGSSGSDGTMTASLCNTTMILRKVSD